VTPISRRYSRSRKMLGSLNLPGREIKKRKNTNSSKGGGKGKGNG